MNIEIRTDKNIQNSERLIDYVRNELTQEFQRYSERITHFSVHLHNQNSDENNIECMLEARPAGLKPVVVHHEGHNIDTAVHGAIDRLKRSLEHTFDKRNQLRGNQPELAAEVDE